MAETTIVLAPPRSAWVRIRRTVRTVRRFPVISVFIIGLVIVAGIGAPWISPHNPTRGTLTDRNMPGFWADDAYEDKTVIPGTGRALEAGVITLEEAQKIKPDAAVGEVMNVLTRRTGGTSNFLGTDHLGRDLLTRTIHGARISLIMAAVTLAIGGTFGVILGLLAGYYGKWVDEIIMRLVDIELALPLILVALVLVVSLGQSLNIMIVILVIWIWPRFARMVRAEVLKLKTMDYVALARVAGASTPRIMFVHLFPGTINTVIVVATLQVGIVILVEASLSFLGAGVPPPTPAWGSMVADGRDRLADAWWISTIPGFAIVFTVMSLNIFGDWLRDTLDPRLRQME